MPTKAKATRVKKGKEELPFKITDHLLVPKHELMTPDDVASIVEFLVSDAAAPLSGTNIPIYSNR